VRNRKEEGKREKVRKVKTKKGREKEKEKRRSCEGEKRRREKTRVKKGNTLLESGKWMNMIRG
jgi:hypothetical protein